MYNAHLSSVTKIINSADGRYLFTCGTDGIVFVFNLKEFYGKGKNRHNFHSNENQSQGNQ